MNFALTLVEIVTWIIIVRLLWPVLPPRVRWHVLQVLIALDQLVTAMLGGWADETLSSYAYRLDKQGKVWGRIWRPTIDWVFGRLFGQVGHCEASYMAERMRSQSPPDERG